MTLDEWYEELQSADMQADGFTNKDLRKFLEVSEDRAGTLIRMWHDKGLVVCAGFRTDNMVDGRPYRAPVYKLVEESRGKKNRGQKGTSPARAKEAKTRRG